MSNFSFLEGRREYALFAGAAQEAERVYASSAAMCAAACRKALELAVKWTYSADSSLMTPYRDNLQALIHDEGFKRRVKNDLWSKLPYIVRLGNLAVHTNRRINQYDALQSLKALFEFVQWIDYCYGQDYEVRYFDLRAIPKEKVFVDESKIKEQERQLEERSAEISELRKQIEELSVQYAKEKEKNQRERSFQPEKISEYETRKAYIDVDMKELGWRFKGESEQNVSEEFEVHDMTGVDGRHGYVDYVLFGQDGLPLAVVEAKRTSKDPNSGRTQALLYADCLERKFKRRPFIFTTNGLETYFWDDKSEPQRRVSGIFSQDDLQKLMDRRESKKKLSEIRINRQITDRPYQMEAIRTVCDQLESRVRRHLLVMATGTGKTRTAASLVDVLSRGGYVTNVLFLADRIALVKQARDSFKDYLPDMSLCNLCDNKDERNARVVFSTYPTMLNEIDGSRAQDGSRTFSPARFDLIIIDESHRSIFKKYKAIFEYFDAVLVGLTATPKTEVDRNTYDFFGLESGVPTYAYDYETAVNRDHVLVPFYNYEVETKILHEGVVYDELPEEDRERYEEAFEDDDFMPPVISQSDINKYFFNETTVDVVLQDLMTRGIKTEGGERLGKTIIFAQSKAHTEFILKRFNALYPEYCGTFAQRVVCDDSYAQSVIDSFKIVEKDPVIVVSVDMMDTGVDAPECVNLVFFKKVYSKTKFWQMIGRGTRLSPNLSCFDQIDGEYVGKRRFLIFDYCGNFEFFRMKPNGIESRDVKTISESLFIKKIQLISAFQDDCFSDKPYQDWRDSLVEACCGQVKSLNFSHALVKMHKRQVEHYSRPEAFANVSESDQADLFSHIAPIVAENESDEFAKRFDGIIYGLILSSIGVKGGFTGYQSKLRDLATMLEERQAIPQIKAKLPEIQKINTEEYWRKKDLLAFERTRRELRGLIKFVYDEGSSRSLVYTKLSDPIIKSSEGQGIAPSDDFENYKMKVNRYIEEHVDTPAIHKLKYNIPLSREDYRELERILTVELGKKEDYQREFGDTPFGLLVRKIVKLDHDAAMEAFAEFINDESLNPKQITFVLKVINYIEKNGYMETNELLGPPFDKPIFIKLFNPQMQAALVKAIETVRNNAVV